MSAVTRRPEPDTTTASTVITSTQEDGSLTTTATAFTSPDTISSNVNVNIAANQERNKRMSLKYLVGS